MVNKSCRWMRVVLPPWWTLGILGTAIIAMIAAEIAMRAWGYGWSYANIVLAFEENDGLQFYSLLIPHVLFLYALWRGVAFHPAWRGKYRLWLETTPWDSSKPLPMGPVHLVWQDVLIVGLATLAWNLPEDRWLIPLAFLVPYCGLLTFANFRTGIDGAGFASLALMASLLLVIEQSMAMLGLMLMTYLICHLGLRRSLQVFPWGESPRWKALTLETAGTDKKKTAFWPLVDDAELSSSHPGLSWQKAGGIATLVAWIAFCLSHSLLAKATYSDQIGFRIALPMWLLAFGSFCCLLRLATYCAKHWTPISWVGRLLTGRWIIPGYDRALVAPLLALAVSYALPRLLIAWSVPLPTVAFLSVLAILSVTLGIGPTLSQWHLIGEHRLYFHRPGSHWKQL